MSTYPKRNRQIPNQSRIHLHLHKPQSALALPQFLFLEQPQNDGLHGLACLTPFCAPKRDQGPVIGGGEHGEGMEVLGRADGVEGAVCVGAGGGVEEGEGACGCGYGDGFERQREAHGA
jgi:hypothetical protein